jgi:hypothetical protein
MFCSYTCYFFYEQVLCRAKAITLWTEKRRIKDTRVNSYTDVELTNQESDYLNEGVIDEFDDDYN